VRVVGLNGGGIAALRVCARRKLDPRPPRPFRPLAKGLGKRGADAAERRVRVDPGPLREGADLEDGQP
jgi:hypothetical protein